MSDVKIQIQGIKAARADYEAKAQALGGQPFVQSIRTAALIVLRDAKMLAPADTGRLRASITPRIEAGADFVKGVVGSNVKYAPYMELGTGTFVGRPRHFPPSGALQTWARRHGIANGYLVARAIGRRGGLEPREFFKRAFENNKARIEQLIGAAVARILTRNGP